ncbi:MarR family transcriptional regulator [Crossiella sp. CA-258035]|uniref:MarR family winged helix-turn-helix transcriptional regulator n=1 Tax=Crossiella sp. CA-258035 TaxID=2981138 RepID=UPI0024BD4408|nr:MarR family transcriptional regulator [Crossiella sp. CA-258035]WHT19441.1 MarR family transcriptional regulator [Crossiella sp. CA-258035]
MSTHRDELVARLANAGRRTSDAAVMFHSALSARLDISVTDWKLLGLLETHGPLSAGELSQHSGLAPASITSAIDRLAKRGYVHRNRDTTDGRRVLIALDEGLLQGVDAQFEGFFRRLGALVERYTDAELDLLAGFLEQNAALMREATAELTER